MNIKAISIIGSGWLGKPLSQHLGKRGYSLRISTTTKDKLASLKSINIEPFIINISNVNDDINEFLLSEYLIINIPSKDVDAFRSLIHKIEKSKIEKVIFVSSTSVYADNNKTVTESDCKERINTPLYIIEQLFSENEHFLTTVIRLGGLIGYSRNPGRFFLSGKNVKNPDAPINLIHRDDCIGIITEIIKKEVWGEVLNCCADTHPTKREFYTQAALSIGENAPNFYLSSDSTYKIVSNLKVKRILNYKFIYPDLMKIKFT